MDILDAFFGAMGFVGMMVLVVYAVAIVYYIGDKVIKLLKRWFQK